MDMVDKSTISSYGWATLFLYVSSCLVSKCPVVSVEQFAQEH